MTDTLIPPPSETPRVLPKAGLGLAALPAIVVGSMVGSGIFALPNYIGFTSAFGYRMSAWVGNASYLVLYIWARRESRPRTFTKPEPADVALIASTSVVTVALLATGNLAVL